MKNCLLLLHGYPFERTLWQGVEERLGPHIFPVTLDLPGFGEEPPSSAEPSLEVMAQHVIQFLQKSHIRRAVVGGFSMGGYVALALAELRPDLLAGLALINTQAAADSEETRQARRALIARLRREGPEAAAEAALPRMFAGPVPRDLSWARVVETGAATAGIAGLSWALEAMAGRPDRSSVLRNLQIPTLIIHSAKDQFIPVERARAAFNLLPNARWVEIPNAGHATPLEGPEQVADALAALVPACF